MTPCSKEVVLVGSGTVIIYTKQILIVFVRVIGMYMLLHVFRFD